ncbi:MAG: hypothetical protein ABI847_08155, partial [Anaerolineales bacterium]
MPTHHFTIEIRWSRKLALALAIAAAIPILAVTGLFRALAAQPAAAPASAAPNGPTTLAYQGTVFVNNPLTSPSPYTGRGWFK